jgi:hypothetical protein
MRFAKSDLPDLYSRCAKQSADGSWVADFGNRTGISSVKNVLLRDSDDVPYLLALKIAKNEMRVEANVAIDPRIVFAFGIRCVLV